MESNLNLNNLDNVILLNNYQELVAIKDRLNTINNSKTTLLSDNDIIHLIKDTLDKIKYNSRNYDFVTLEILSIIGDMINKFNLNTNIIYYLRERYMSIHKRLYDINKNLESQENYEINLDLNKLENEILDLSNQVFSVITTKENYMLVWSLLVQIETLKVYSK